MTVFYDESYSSGLDASARFPVDRYALLAERLGSEELRGLIEIKRPRLATREEILLVHDPDYADRFFAMNLREDEMRRIGLRPWKTQIVERTLRLVGGALEALDELLMGASIAANMAGGTHHAFRAAGAGYCIFNDLAVCAEVSLRRAQASRILILDLDVHQGDGTAEIFKGEDRVFTASIHGKDNFPFRKRQSDLDLALPSGTGDSEFLDALAWVLEQLSPHSFDQLFLQAGVDALAEDSLGHLKLSRAGMRRRNELVFQWRKERKLPMLIFMGGGYSKPIDHTLDAFTDLFVGAALERLSMESSA